MLYPTLPYCILFHLAMPLRTYTGTDNEDGDDVGNDSEEKMLRTQTVDDFLVLLEKPKLPQVLAQVRTYLTCCSNHWNCFYCSAIYLSVLSLMPLYSCLAEELILLIEFFVMCSYFIIVLSALPYLVCYTHLYSSALKYLPSPPCPPVLIVTSCCRVS